MRYSYSKLCNPWRQFVVFELLSHCFEERIGFDVCKASSVASNQTSWYNKRTLRKEYSVPRDFSWIENYKLKTDKSSGIYKRESFGNPSSKDYYFL